MFERFSESARRVIFFARYETSNTNAREIAPEHLLLGLCRETPLKTVLSADEIRQNVKNTKNPRLATSVDAPLTGECKRILAHASSEAELHGSAAIEPVHLALGIRREPQSGAARLLQAQGLDAEKLIELIPLKLPGTSATARQPDFGCFERLRHLVASAAGSEIPDPNRMIESEGWTRKQALTHLLDLAVAHYGWLHLPDSAPDLPDAALGLALEPASNWDELLARWQSVNERIIAAAEHIPRERWTSLRLGLIRSYTGRTEVVINQILA